jgi:hypothetical protein
VTRHGRFVWVDRQDRVPRADALYRLASRHRYEILTARCEVEFWRGFVRGVSFRTWRFCDQVLPHLVADQSLCAPGLLAGAIPELVVPAMGGGWTPAFGHHVSRRDARTAAVLYRGRTGPALELVSGFDPVRPRSVTFWPEGDRDDALGRAEREVAAALVSRARQIHRRAVEPGVDPRGADPGFALDFLEVLRR